MKHLAISACAALALAACKPAEDLRRGTVELLGGEMAGSESATPAITAEAFRAHVTFLADDLMEGREAGSRGYDLAANYVASQMALIGLAPAGEDETYFQRVPFRATRPDLDAAELEIIPADGGDVELTHLEDFLIGTNSAEELVEIEGEVVFVGYGVEAPAFGHDDYQGLDVDGKIVAVLAGGPSFLPSEEGAHYASGREKARAAERHGAVGMLTILTPAFERRFNWERAARGIENEGLTWIGPDGQAFRSAPGIRATATLHPDATERLFAGAERSYQDIRESLAEGAPQGFPLNASVRIRQGSLHSATSSPNVAGIIRGADPALRDEYVIVSAHLDHIGIGGGDPEDQIRNGALDNASGIASMLEAARAMMASGRPPRRSVVFLAVTAEEKGLLGAEYFAHNPTVPKDGIVANVNLDMPVLLYDFADVVGFGADHSTLGDVLDRATAEMGLAVTPDPMPEQAIFTRSDHYRFVQQGVPAIFLMTGWNTTDPDGEGKGGEIFLGFLSGDYHGPKDDLNQPINWEAGRKFALLNYYILREIADADERPQWRADSFFGQEFGQ